MNDKLLLVTCITLLFRESQIKGPHDNSSKLVREALKKIQLPELTVGLDHEKEILEGLKSTALMMCDAQVDHEFPLTEILQRLKVVTMTEETLYQSFVDAMEVVYPEDILKRTCLSLRSSLSHAFRTAKVEEIISKAFRQVKYKKGEFDTQALVREICSDLEPFQIDVMQKDPAINNEIDLTDHSKLQNVFSSINDEQDGTSVMRVGYQGINRMLDGGFRRGENWVIGALQHKYKTGFTLSLFKQIALYNKPVMIDQTKKPLLVRISFEDTANLNFQFLYQSLYENETGKAAEFLQTDDEELKKKAYAEMARYVTERLTAMGYHVKIMDVNPSLWTYKDITNKILEFEAQGYEVHVCMLDYLLKLPTTGCDQGPHGHDIRNLYERLYNFFKARKTCFITPHQLSTEAKTLVRQGEMDLVKKVNGGGYYAGCKQIDQVVDGELYIHIEEVNGASFLTVQRGKHRKIKQTPKEDLYCVLPFQKIGGIRDDVNGVDTTRKRVGGGPIGSANEIPHWEADPLSA